MAKVTVDISEYDMLRENKIKAENRVEELLKEIEEYKKKARVVITTKHIGTKIDIDRALREAYKRVEYNLQYRGMDVRLLGLFAGHLKETIVNNSSAFGADNYSVVNESSQIVGFEDVRIEVENKIKKEYTQQLENELSSYKAQKSIYEEKLKELDATYLEEHSEEKKALIDKHKDDVKRYNDKIAELKIQIEELSKTSEDKIIEAERQMREAQKILDELKGRKNWFKRLFK